MNAPVTLNPNMPRHFLDLSDHSGDVLKAMITDAKRRKKARLGLPKGVPDADAPMQGSAAAPVFRNAHPEAAEAARRLIAQRRSPLRALRKLFGRRR